MWAVPSYPLFNAALNLHHVCTRMHRHTVELSNSTRWCLRRVRMPHPVQDREGGVNRGSLSPCIGMAYMSAGTRLMRVTQGDDSFAGRATPSRMSAEHDIYRTSIVTSTHYLGKEPASSYQSADGSTNHKPKPLRQAVSRGPTCAAHSIKRNNISHNHLHSARHTHRKPKAASVPGFSLGPALTSCTGHEPARSPRPHNTLTAQQHDTLPAVNSQTTRILLSCHKLFSTLGKSPRVQECCQSPMAVVFTCARRQTSVMVFKPSHLPSASPYPAQCGARCQQVSANSLCSDAHAQFCR